MGKEPNHTRKSMVIYKSFKTLWYRHTVTLPLQSPPHSPVLTDDDTYTQSHLLIILGIFVERLSLFSLSPTVGANVLFDVSTIDVSSFVSFVKYGVGSPKFIWIPHAQLCSLAATPQRPPPRNWAQIQELYCSSKIDDISL